ncbi:MAG: Trigger factor [Candidatus Woesebacteria bacterium GW2011_GWB1_45_5]|uniref:Trigger factor n=1 Tax=Candidatus Woesebacteria bacterium GW2011_GWB1_45_5 TaxID=1618581 RepID=A0A0G1MNW7_9BACT|nr:MAG: Trigger factor [Candidatus Woesebacteria bacterium GW2011_GWB1_45_5]
MADIIKSVVAKEDDGNVQITFTIPFAVVKKAQDETVKEFAKDIEVPGFRKGNAPLDKVAAKIPQNSLIEHSLSHILPSALAAAIKEHSIKIAVYPKYELISADEGKDWQIRAVTCELPEINLGDYKTKIPGEIRAISIKKEPTREEKEQVVIKTLVENVKFQIPKILIEQEVDSRLSNLLSRVEKLGLALESYLQSIGKNPETLRAEYKTQAKEAIALDLILSRVVETENLKVDEKEVNEALKISQASQTPTANEDPENRKRVLESILKKRKALDFLTNLA